MTLERRHVLLLTAGVFAFVGLWAMISPGGLVALMGLKAEGIDALGDVRAMYGGLQLGIAGLLVWHALDEDRVSAGLVLAAVCVGGIGGARLLSQLVTGFAALSTGLCLIEIGGAVICAWFSQQR